MSATRNMAAHIKPPASFPFRCRPLYVYRARIASLHKERARERERWAERGRWTTVGVIIEVSYKYIIIKSILQQQNENSIAFHINQTTALSSYVNRNVSFQRNSRGSVHNSGFHTRAIHFSVSSIGCIDGAQREITQFFASAKRNFRRNKDWKFNGKKRNCVNHKRRNHYEECRYSVKWLTTKQKRSTTHSTDENIVSMV